MKKYDTRKQPWFSPNIMNLVLSENDLNANEAVLIPGVYLKNTGNKPIKLIRDGDTISFRSE